MRLLVLVLLVLGGCATASTSPQGMTPGTAREQWVPPALPPATPIQSSEYAARRQALLDAIDDGVLVVFGSPPPAFDYLPFAQAPDFRYLTGIVEPGGSYIAVKQGGRVEERLFVLPRDPAREQWEGARLGPDGARARTGIPAATNDRFTPVLDSLLRVHGTLYSTTAPPVVRGLDANLSHAQQILARLREVHPQLEVRSVQGAIRQLRGVKSDAELDRIRRAVYISSLAHREAMRSVQPGMNEFELRALVEYFFRRYGAEGPAYGSIVGSGPNSTTLHYQASDRFMEAGDVLLIDAAASYGGYAADVTRTFPVNGRFAAEQRAVYEVVLAAQKAAESQIREGATWSQLNEAASDQLREGLARLGLIDGPDATYDCRGAAGGGACPQFRLWYMHGLGHGVGLAVHDPDISETPGGFRPGSAVTIEPGIYIRPDVLEHLPDTPANRAFIERIRPAVERYRNIGVRIEDVFIFDRTGIERVSAGVPREIDEIEALMSESGLGGIDRRGGIVDWFRRNQGR
ncbi:MAG TPA: aminopeptidase P N-terminal domain-containing protein [Longimicrobiales bacterium]|nr:aminopeptidase P N-terminal domain-containing protein [Longimicrobiales bacterium]